MDFESEGFDQETAGGSVRFNRLAAIVNGHTHVYQFPDDETDTAVWVIREHVADGRLHPYAGLILLTMIGELHES
jgi:hypothetical protein